MKTAITDLMGNGMGDILSGIFLSMEHCENVIAEMKDEYPDKADVIHDCFRFLMPPDPIRGKGAELYRAHCREIIERIISHGVTKDINLVTSAEICAILCETSLKAPLNQDASFVYAKHFKRIFPDQDIDFTFNSPTWDGAEKEVESEINRKFKANRYDMR